MCVCVIYMYHSIYIYVIYMGIYFIYIVVLEYI